MSFNKVEGNYLADILVVDDNAVSLKLLKDLLSLKGYRTRTSNSGKMALSAFLDKTPDLILLDVKMPDIDGYEVCSYIKTFEEGKKVPVIFISSLEETDDKINGFNVGAVDYITKPFYPEEVIARVKTHLKLRSLQEELEQSFEEMENCVLQRTFELEQANVELKEANYVLGKEIAERMEIEAALTRAKEEAEAANIAQSQFFANISHELRTPLNVILSSIQLYDSYLKESKAIDSNFKSGKYNKVIKQNCFRLLRMINNLIDITKIDSRYFDLQMQNCNIIKIVEDITISVADYIESMSIALVFDTDKEEKILACDPDKIERILLNLLSNAVKYTNPGGEINVNMFDKGESVFISVKDTGTGIPYHKQKEIFERFVQADQSLTRRHEGSGIGLSLVKALVELHGGKITLESEVGKGSEFIIELPVKIVEESDSPDINNSVFKNNIEKINIEFSDIYECMK